MEQWGPKQGEWATFFDAEIDNVRASLEWLLETEELGGASQLLLATTRYWDVRGNFSEAQSWTERTLQLDTRVGPGSKRTMLELVLARHDHHLGNLSRALLVIDTSLAHAMQSGDRWTEAQARHVLGIIHATQGEFETAIPFFESALSDFRESHDTLWQAYVLNSLGYSNCGRGALEVANTQLDEALSLFTRDGNSFGIGTVLVNLARIARLRKDYVRSIALLIESLSIWERHGDMLALMGCLRGLGRTLAHTGEFENATRCLAAAEGTRIAIGAGLPRHPARYNLTIDRMRSELGAERFDAIWQDGLHEPIADLVSWALARQYEHDAPDSRSSRSARLGDLTPRECEVLRLICAGRSNREISETLFISERTAQTHVQHILDKLGVNSRSAAAVRAVELGLV